jgi:hypothetical protein
LELLFLGEWLCKKAKIIGVYGEVEAMDIVEE